MHKILVEIYLPVRMQSVDVFIPVKSKMGEVLALIKAILPELTDGLMLVSEDTVLCDRKTGRCFDPNQTVAEAGLKNGSELCIL